MHWPVAFKGDEKRENGKPVIDEKLTADPYPTWKKLEEMVKKGKVRNIGVSKSVITFSLEVVFDFDYHIIASTSLVSAT
jgi:diketogulonate reductase-like aldo/keto reductase